MSDRFKLISAAYLLFRDHDRVLLSRRFNTGFMDGHYGLVSGHLEGDEPVTVCAVREAKEEAGVEIDSNNLVFRHVMHRRMKDERIDFFFEPLKWSGVLKNCELDRCDDLSWFPINELPESTIPYIRQAIESIENGLSYSEFWQPQS